MSSGIGIGVSAGVFSKIQASPSFEYSAVAFCQNASNPTPTIVGTPGGTFSASPVAPNTGTLSINSSTGEVNLAASDSGNYLVTYSVGGVQESDPFQVIAVQTTGFSYSASSFEDNGTATPTITGSAGGTFTSSPVGLSINSSTGVIDLSNSDIGGPYTITYTNSGLCPGTPSTFDVSITATVRIIANNFAMDFNGTDDYISAGNDSSLEITGNFTISVWTKLNTMTGYRRIIGKTNSGNSRANYGLGLFQGYKPGVIANATGTWFTNYSSTPLSTGVWHHLVGIYDGSNFILYVNGSLDNSTSVSGFNIATAASQTSGDDLLIGALPNNTENFNGDMDEVAIWNKAISANAVQEIYNATINNPGFTADLFKLANESQAPVFWNRMGDD